MCFTVAIQKNAKKVDLHYFGGEVPRKKKKLPGMANESLP